MSSQKEIREEDHMINSKYRMFTEDEMKELKHRIYNWSDRMKEESNFLYKLKYSLGTITQPFIEGVIESVESSGDFEITSFGHSKFILFVGGNQPPLEKDADRTFPSYSVIPHSQKKAEQRLQHKHFQITRSGDYTCFISKEGKQWVLSESQQNSFSVTLKPRLDLTLMYEILSSEGVMLSVPPSPKRIRKGNFKQTRVIE